MSCCGISDTRHPHQPYPRLSPTLPGLTEGDLNASLQASESLSYVDNFQSFPNLRCVSLRQSERAEPEHLYVLIIDNVCEQCAALLLVPGHRLLRKKGMDQRDSRVHWDWYMICSSMICGALILIVFACIAGG